MSVLRYDPTTSDWVVFAPSRALRPHDGQRYGEPPAEPAEALAACPFCPGNESLAPPEIYAVRPPGAGPSQWQVRVVPNKFPALRIEDDPARREDGPAFRSMGGCGAHEVVIESPDHARSLAQQPVDQIERVLATLQRRHQDLLGDRRFQTVIIFKNHGPGAGTSLRHPHWQLIATPVVPRMLRLKHTLAAEYFDQTGHCLYCDLVEQELSQHKRVLAVNEHFVAIMPFASHVPFETWILPRRQQASFTRVEAGRLLPLAELLKQVLLRLATGLGNPDYNLSIDAVPRTDEEEEYFLWHMRILPRLSTPAGFELGSGMSINTVLPEDAVAFLHETAV